jgi:orotate phosphoribosyltransferase
MKGFETLVEKALKYKENGLNEYEIAEELNLSTETVRWLLSKGELKKPTSEVKIGWRSIGVYPSRISSISDALCDILIEESNNRNFDVDTIVGVAVNGIPYATLMADKLCLELAIFRPYRKKTGAFSSNYASINGKNVVIVDDVVGTGNTFRAAINSVKKEKGKPLLCLAVVNKRSENDIDGVPLRALIRTRII